MIKIEITDGVANVYAPYNPDFVKKIKGIGGAKWNSSEKCWSIPETSVEAAREIMTDVYGYSDVKENETITLKITFNGCISECRGDVVLFGKVLAHAYGRDSGARPGEDVAYISGGAASGGSAKNWNSIVKNGSVAILSNVNKTVYEKSKDSYNDDDELKEIIVIEVIETKANKQSLLNEKERLLKRIAEIDKLLQEEV